MFKFFFIALPSHNARPLFLYSETNLRLYGRLSTLRLRVAVPTTVRSQILRGHTTTPACCVASPSKSVQAPHHWRKPAQKAVLRTRDE